MAIGAVISYRKNEIRLTAVNFITGAFLYWYLAGELIDGKSLFTYHENTVLAALFTGEVIFCAGSLILAFYQRRYNRRLPESASKINRWFLSERGFNYLTAIFMFLIGCYLLSMALTESRSGLATGGLFFQSHRLAEAPQLFRQLIEFHLALGILPIIGGAWLLLFPPKKIRSKIL